ncbi:bifunctional methylenetetrahydrofolate dehydrogenase/methenyltetrahydrofolate cyclohydrolase [Neoehrlichia mikurensis]|uniref:Bifunctional protein FolD n=1 Tax=Neoehrlichia mikurensis TaxID=89586 RepID=A0A9Q9BTM8_9RICK|nr:tetrahydrofolate dehydrogenase/cyclohydrolase catalytic domain-containing protein [Neoehrlichia mikurensis]QXK91731.1 bifunctional methylenetetrahydrofolate dehydrogenase/methenyltetrahydrofolate cyclohydrolase [Neoehrlichia mikurensis]QXK92943.1 bifunctional methylenetetrahydrofolate dehydrogenase/methenyltetrahydrofolate cyclohydrolase [Neoehrlichia mikurensis]QXK93421.1 bifunctional methylenetetrahydrofolate dehydrogenase/methenyltetrahydrofolate cyclohydrolase [Neoehrlichia mikurensis]UT
MNSNIIDGKLASSKLLNHLSGCISDLKRNYDLIPSLIVIIVGDDPASRLYVSNKQKKAEKLGILAKTVCLPSTTSQDELLGIINTFNIDPSVNGILVQLPLPKHIDKNVIINAINPCKDVDGFHNENAGKLATGQLDCLLPCTPQGCVYLIKTILNDLSGSNAVVIGRSNIVGKPLASLLLRENCTVTIVHSASTDIIDYCCRADILVAAVGKACLVKSSWVKPGAVVIDVGINLVNQDGNNKFVGDVDFNEVKNIASAITSVPGGVGPMTVAFLMVNTVISACKQYGYDKFIEKYLRF